MGFASDLPTQLLSDVSTKTADAPERSTERRYRSGHAHGTSAASAGSMTPTASTEADWIGLLELLGGRYPSTQQRGNASRRPMPPALQDDPDKQGRPSVTPRWHWLDWPHGHAQGDGPAVDIAADNISDGALKQFRAKYGPDVTKDGVCEYLYGVMHSPEWRMDCRHDPQRNMSRIPLADDFEPFRAAGRKLMDLHVGYETVDEYPVQCLVDGEPDEGEADGDAYRIEGRMRWGRRPDGSDDRTVLVVNSRCRLVGIPLETVHYSVSGRTPLQWAIDRLRVKHDDASGTVDDPNGWRDWAGEPFNLIRHLRRLVTVGYESALTIAWLPTSRPGESHLYELGPVTLADIIESQGKGPPSEDSTGIIYTEEEFVAHLESLLDEPPIE